MNLANKGTMPQMESNNLLFIERATARSIQCQLFMPQVPQEIAHLEGLDNRLACMAGCSDSEELTVKLQAKGF